MSRIALGQPGRRPKLVPDRAAPPVEPDVQIREPETGKVVDFRVPASTAAIADDLIPSVLRPTDEALVAAEAATVLDRVYADRFSDAEALAKDGLWREVVRYLNAWIPRDAAVLDIGCDRGYFIRNVIARDAWATDIRDMSAHVGPDAHFVRADGLKLLDHLPRDHFDVIFMSNYLEHLPSAQAVIDQLAVARELLRPGGRVVILQPNIRLVGGAYWDFIDHKVPLTEHSLQEAADITGLDTEHVIVRFLPYTTKGRLGGKPWLVRAYLKVPLAWRVLGRQTLFIARRPA
jgi:SAM-dependent methyltransferase